MAFMEKKYYKIFKQRLLLDHLLSRNSTILLLSEGEITITFLYERVKINCVGINSTA